MRAQDIDSRARAEGLRAIGPDPRHPTIEAEGMAYEGMRFRAQGRLVDKPYGRPFGVDMAFAEPLSMSPDIILGERDCVQQTTNTGSTLESVPDPHYEETLSDAREWTDDPGVHIYKCGRYGYCGDTSMEAVVDTQIIATNLVRLRKERRKTQEEVAAAAGLSRGAFRNIEKGRSMPKVENLRAIASALDVPMRELVTPVPRLQRVRFRSLKRLKCRDQVLVAVGRWLHDFNELEELLDEQVPHELGALWDMVTQLRPQGVEVIAAASRQHFGLGVREPVHDICGLLESRGVKVHTVQVANDAFLGLSVAEEDGGLAVVVNTWDRLAVEHWIYSAVHELGHLLLHLGAYDVEEDKEDVDQEREAEIFASHFLMPEDVFLREWRGTAGLALIDRVLKVKRVFRVSWRTVLYRVAEHVPKKKRGELWIRMNVEYKRRYRRSLLKRTEPHGVGEGVFRAPVIAGAGAEPASLDQHDFQDDRLARLVRRGVEREAITLGRGGEILGLPLDQMRDRASSWQAFPTLSMAE